MEASLRELAEVCNAEGYGENLVFCVFFFKLGC